MLITNTEYIIMLIFALIGGVSVILFIFKLLNKNIYFKTRFSIRDIVLIIALIGSVIYIIFGFKGKVDDNMANSLSAISLGFSFLVLAVSTAEQDLSTRKINDLEKKIDKLINKIKH